MSFPRYPEYKDSGVEWLSKVPQHWETTRLKRVVDPKRQITYGIVQAGPDIPDGIPYIRPADMTDESGVRDPEGVMRTSQEIANAYTRSTIRKGDIVCSIGPSFGKLMETPEWLDGANLTQGTARIAVQASTNTRFLFWVLRSRISYQQWDSSVGGATFRALNLAPLAETAIPHPPLSEQTAIAAFLDRETAKIDELVAEQRRLMELLKEKRQAVISHAVTKGLNPDAPMKPSGIEWLGDVPEHWEAGKLKRWIQKIESGTSVNAADEPANAHQIGVLKTSCVYTGKFDPNENKVVVSEELDRVTCPLRMNSLIVSRMNTPDLVGAAGLVTEAPPNVFLPDRLWQVTTIEVEPEFIYLWTLSSLYRGQIQSVCTGTSSSMKNLTQDQFGSLIVCCPPQPEQSKIIECVKAELRRLDTLTTESQRAIDLLQERRTALISAAVTGQIDVRNN